MTTQSKQSTQAQQQRPSNKHARPLHTPTIVNTPASPTPQSINALLPFALQPAHKPNTHHTTTITPSLLDQIKSSPITLITGPSGSGKSTLLRTLQNQLQSQSQNQSQNITTPSSLPPINQSLPIINLFHPPLSNSDSPSSSSPLPTAHCPLPSSPPLSLLSSTGLAEPKLWALPQHALSTGEQARLQIARLIHHAQQHNQQHNQPTHHILLDELATPLDRLTARSLCASLNKLIARNPSLKIIAAAAHEDLPTYLNTTLLINAADHQVLPSQYAKEPITIEQATQADYQSLSHLHYIAGPPANPCQYLRATRPHPITKEPVLAAILVVTYPTLNASWRKRAWPNRYNSGNKSQDAKRINKELRCLARVITAPHSRGLGLATQLVKHYLSNPLTPATEAVAAMGTISPFFKNAGMTQYPIPHTPADNRLLDALDHLNQTPHDLLHIPRNFLQTNSSLSCSSPGLPGEVSPSSATEGVFSPSSSSPLPTAHRPLPLLLIRELKTWARTKNLNPNDPNLPNYAAFKLLTKPCAYTHVQQKQQAQQEQKQ